MSHSFKLKLLRDDIALASIPDLPSNALLSPPVVTRKSLIGCVNDVRVNYVLRVGLPDISISYLSCDYSVAQVVLSNGTIYTWGDGWCGQLGNNTDDEVLSSAPVIPYGDHNFIYGGIYPEHAWGIDDQGQLWCWGEGDNGEYGDGSHGSVEYPIEGGIGYFFSKVRMGGRHTMGLESGTGKLYGWGYQTGGDPAQGECGLGPAYTPIEGLIVLLPVQEYLGKTDWVDVWCGWNFSIAIDSSGRLWGTGNNGCSCIGQPGESGGHQIQFTQIGTDTDWAKVRVGDCHCLAQKNNGDVYYWGTNTSGQFGDGTAKYTGETYTPVKMEIPDVQDFMCGAFFSAILKSDGTLWMAGENSAGQLGLGYRPTDVLIYTQITNCPAFSKIAEQGEAHMLAVTEDNQVYEWGYTMDGYYTVPTLVNFDFTGS